MKERKFANDWLQVCEGLGPDDGIPPAILARKRLSRSQRHKSDHRAWQYCKQVQLAIEDGLACDCGDPYLQDLTIECVEPISGGAAVLVTVATREMALEQIDEIHRRLAAATGTLRSAVASGTHRKRVPALRFRVVPCQD